ncbi:MAG: PQQ-dependent sugar dehydrogenase [Halioglobus sp.]
MTGFFRAAWLCALVLIQMSGCTGVLTAPEPEVAERDLAVIDSGPSAKKIRVKILVEGLKEPWGMDFLPDGRMLVTEKAGGLKLVDLRADKLRDVRGVPAVANAGQGGLMDVLAHPAFEDNRLIYFSYTVEENGLYSTQVSRARLKNRSLVEHEILFTARPFFSERRHFGSRLLLDEGYLYITVGDRGNRDLAQTLTTHNGKVLRLTEDGQTPFDNPFIASASALPEIWSYGHRNPQGMAKHPDTGEIWISEHGPQGGDEINRLVAGENYGWPVITYGEEYGGGKIGEGTHKAGMMQPLAYYTPSIGTAGMDFYSGDIYPDWKPSLVVAGLRLNQIARLELGPEGVSRRYRLLAGLGMRIRDVKIGPDGLIYALAEGSRLIRLEPAN